MCVFMAMGLEGCGTLYSALRLIRDYVVILVLYPRRIPVCSGGGRTFVVLPLLWRRDQVG